MRWQAVTVSRMCFWILCVTPQMITVKFVEMVERGTAQRELEVLGLGPAAFKTQRS